MVGDLRQDIYSEIVQSVVEDCGWSGPLLWLSLTNGYSIHFYDNVIYYNGKILLPGIANLNEILEKNVQDLIVDSEAFKLVLVGGGVLHIESSRDCDTARIFKQADKEPHWVFEAGCFDRDDRIDDVIEHGIEGRSREPVQGKVNDDIISRQVRLIDENGDSIGVIETEEALNKARSCGLDLVEVAPNTNPPVVRIMDYSRYIFELKKKYQTAVKSDGPKVIRLLLKTGRGSLRKKAEKAIGYLMSGIDIEVQLQLRKRDTGKEERAMSLISYFIKLIDCDSCIVGKVVQNERRFLILIKSGV